MVKFYTFWDYFTTIKVFYKIWKIYIIMRSFLENLQSDFWFKKDWKWAKIVSLSIFVSIWFIDRMIKFWADLTEKQEGQIIFIAKQNLIYSSKKQSIKNRFNKIQNLSRNLLWMCKLINLSDSFLKHNKRKKCLKK